ncbi:MAG: conjugative transposon protein TraM [Crocinitomicaceae bacterium]|nr:conjugative transposon protein TraM [Crocinitomicaceae bacterium]
MKTQEKKAKERRFLVALPLLALPFITVIFWAMGGGTGAAGQQVNNLQTSLNPALPSGKMDDTPRDKLSYYEIAEKDSAELLELIKRDPNYRHEFIDSPYTDDPYGDPYGQQYGDGRYENPTANRIYRGLNELEREMQQPYSAQGSYGGNGGYGGYQPYDTPAYAPQGTSPEMYRLEQMMAELNQQTSAPDPEMDQLNTMLDKIMEIQNPGLADERLREKSAERRGEVFAVTGNPQNQQVSLLDATEKAGDPGIGFFSLEDGGFSDLVQNAIKAVVHEDQTLVNGSTVKLRLINDIYVNGIRIPRDNFLFGIAQLTGERLTIKIESIRYGQSLYPVELAVYDMDGLDGVYIPGSITRDVAKQSADRPLQGLSLSSLDPSWGAQAAGAGVEVVKGLFSKTAKLIKVKVKAGYQVLLRDGKQKSSQGY